MEKLAVYHRPNKEFCYYLGEEILFKIRTKKNDCNIVNLYYVEKWAHREEKDLLCKEMTLVASDNLFSYYECLISFKGLGISYFFELKSDITIYYGNHKFFNSKTLDGNDMFECPLQARYDESYKVPSWAPGAVVYQIFPERFHKLNDEYSKDKWDMVPMTRDAFLGGTLNGIKTKIPYLKELGIDVLYMCPIFESNSNHKYDTIDYFKVDPHFGTNQDLKELVDEAHKNNIKVMLDGVFNHCGYDFKYFVDVRENGRKSKYFDWFYIDGDYPLWDKGENPWYEGIKPNYDTFAFYGGMPKMNTSNKEVRAYFFDCVKMWIKSFGIDGFRLDVPEEYSHDFSKELRCNMIEANKECLISGEVWHEASDYLLGDEFDTVMNYVFRNACIDLLVNNSIKVNEFFERLGFLRGLLRKDTNTILWNLLDSHDTPRFLYLLNEDKNKLKIAVALQMTVSGMPFIYYGDEVGMTGDNDPDCRRGMLWDDSRDLELLEFYKALINVRHESNALMKGELENLSTDDNVMIFKKKYNNDQRIIIINLTDKEQEISYSGTNIINHKLVSNKVGAFEIIILK